MIDEARTATLHLVKVSLFIGDIADAAAEAICTSTNPRLSLMMGTGGSVRERGGSDVKRACEALIDAEAQRTGSRNLRLGSAHVTTAGRLPFKGVIHCVASDTSHMSSPDVVRACVRNALATADANGFASVAMPVFASGHAHVKFDRALTAMREAFDTTATAVREVVVVISDDGRQAQANELLALA